MTRDVQLELFEPLQPLPWPSPNPGDREPVNAIAADELRWQSGVVRIWYVIHPRARHYRLALRADGNARCTVPSRGSLAGARRFVTGVRVWLVRQWERRQLRPAPVPHWSEGTLVWFRGEPHPLRVGPVGENGRRDVSIGTFNFILMKSASGAADPVAEVTNFRSGAERALRRLAAQELPPRVVELAGAAGIEVSRISVRNQRTRWGSCSRRGLISLNWRLVQTPDFVRDYIILHELAHRRHMNHSASYWAEVARLCPGWEQAEAWIKRHGRELL